jgi:hypothetical protein
MRAMDLELGPVLGAAALWTAAMQVVWARRADLGPLTIGVAGAAAIARGADPRVALALAGSAGLAAWGWARSERRGVARPFAVGLSLAAALAADAAIRWVPAAQADHATGVAAVCVALGGAWLAARAAEGPAIRPARVRWIGAVDIRSPDDAGESPPRGARPAADG